MEEREIDAKKRVNDSPMGTVWITYKFSLNYTDTDLSLLNFLRMKKNRNTTSPSSMEK